MSDHLRGLRLRKTVHIALACFVLAAAFYFGPATTAPARGAPVTPDGEILVVTANLLEAHDPQDLRNLREMKVFVRRLLDKLPLRPDVLLLQEVSHRSAGKVARLLTEKTADTYGVAVDAGDKVTVKLSPSKYFHRETAIVINRTTMAKVSSGYLRTSYAPRHASGTSKVGVRRQSLMLAEEKVSGFRLALASVHLATKSALRTHDLSQSYRNQWAKQVSTALRKRYPAEANAVTVGGDFNQDMCEYTIEKDCRPWAPFYKTYVDGLDLKDSVRNVIGGHGVDFVFTEGRVVDVGKDATYEWKNVQHDPSRYYSDHAFRWALVGQP